MELVHRREVRVETELDDRSERARRRDLGGRNAAPSGHRKGPVVQLARRAKLSPGGRAGGAARKQGEGAPAEVAGASGTELVCERERTLGVVRDDLRVLLRALARRRFEPARVVVVDARPLDFRKRRVRDIADQAVAEDKRGTARRTAAGASRDEPAPFGL